MQPAVKWHLVFFSAISKSLVTLKRPVYLLWYSLKPDWNFSQILISTSKSFFYYFFYYFLNKRSFWYWYLVGIATAGSNEGFFRIGWTVTCWNTSRHKSAIHYRQWNYRPKVSITSSNSLIGTTSVWTGTLQLLNKLIKILLWYRWKRIQTTPP